MSRKHSIANKKKWANRTPERNSQIMSTVANKRWSVATSEDRKKQGLMLMKARKSAKELVSSHI